MLWAKRLVLVALGIAALAIAAKISVPMWPSPVPITLGTFAVLTIGAAYGPRLGLATILGYLASARSASTSSPAPRPRRTASPTCSAAPAATSSATLLATLALGFAARRGWDRSVGGMALAMLVGNVLIYIPGAALAEPPDRRRPVRPGEVRLALGADAGLGPDALPDRRRDQARARRAGGAGPLEAGRQRPHLSSGADVTRVRIPEQAVAMKRDLLATGLNPAESDHSSGRSLRQSTNRTAPMCGRLRLRWA